MTTSDASRAWSFFSDAELRERHLRRNFSSLSAVHAFHNHLVSGDASLHFLQYFQRRYVGPERAIDAVSLGCGNGHLERTLLGFGYRFRSARGLELNPELVAFAQAQVAPLAGGETVVYEVADLNRLSLAPASLDLAIFFHSLHHVQALERTLAEVARSLRPGGKLLVVDYFGGNRLQRTRAQLAACDALLRRIPERYRVDLGRSAEGKIVLKERCENLDPAGVAAGDPSEAIRSEDIEGCLERVRGLTCVEEKPLGGTILDPLFLDIAGNFLPDDPVANAHVDMAIAAEEALLVSKAFPSDYRFLVFERRATRWFGALRGARGR